MEEQKVEGIVLKTVPFKENDRILTLYTPQQGVMSLYVQGLSKKKPALTNLATPLCRGEYLFRKGRSDLHKFFDGTILDLHLPLRKSYTHLQVGGKILQTIHETQLPGKSSPALYALLVSYLKKLGDATFPETLLASFHLKLLKHEGVLSLENLPSSLDEKTIHILTTTRQFEPLLDLELPPSLLKGIDALLAAQF
jgi:DNA repair protein RecO (recombination protein O)